MIDHAPYFRARARAEQENKEMAELEQCAAPLHWAIYLAIILLAASQLWDGWEDYLDMVAANEAMVQCLNGRTIGIGDAVMRCDVRQIVGASLLAKSFAAETAPTTEVQP